MGVWIGTSGWQYDHWRGLFYPRGVPARRWLEHYAERFAAVELNASFYRLPAERTFRAWAERTPDDFVVAVKASRFLTHVRRLREPEGPVHLLMERAGALGRALGPVLLQLPPNMTADASALDRTLAAFPAGTRVAVEPRHDSWFVPEVERVLRRRGAALCLADRRGPVTPLWRTADWTYLRLHEGRASPRPCYGDQALRSWAERLADGWGADADVYVFTNNDPQGCAVRDAVRLAHRLERLGLHTTRVPELSEAPVAGG